MVLTIHIEDNIAHIDGMGWHAYCNTSGNLVRSNPGTLDMIKACITFVFKRFPSIKHVTLIDNSKIKCTNKVDLDLGPHYISKYGQTWYERHLGARLEDQNTQNKYNSFINKLKGPKPFDFKHFKQTYLIKSRVRNLHDVLEPLYDSSETLQSFLQQCNKEFECMIFEGWLSYFVSAFSGIRFWDTYWTIDRQTWKNINISVTKDNDTTKSDDTWSQFGGVPSHLYLRHGKMHG
jgi:hypothetical protein